MSEAIGTPYGDPAPGSASAETVHEAYAFACLRCGHGWEQSYDIVHTTDETGRTTVTYYDAGHARVPSPLTRPVCQNCGGHTVRIMRSGRVSVARRWDPMILPFPEQYGAVSERHDAAYESGGPDQGASGDSAAKPRHHWSLADLFHLFHRGHGRDRDRAA
ncbi:hypothetical protein [Streptantibioticus ferralitis]|uniref:Uncharacterized protein n=1 Tax=Streptantibioticus ferralitis TaxID=236510 RepID=A0ABT5Z8Y6_9ACTN|nr:hypothetical protein [Streptantibioticus ferralitis]MDF2260291.1 hypothetical protein [Streptantibioticus ferralitis]